MHNAVTDLPILDLGCPAPVSETAAEASRLPSDARAAGTEPLPDYAYAWRPYANPENIYKHVATPAGGRWFVIDPWNQRWAIASDAVSSLLKLADGRTRLSEIVRSLTAEVGPAPPGGYAGLAADLAAHGLLFANQEVHRQSGLPVYNSCAPIGLHLEVTNACNMTCTHCYVSSGRKLPNELTYDEIIRTIDMLPPFSGKRVAISGGEPAVRKDCAAIIRHCAVRCGHDVDLYTNGKHFPQALADEIRAINGRGLGRVRIQLSLEGATAETNDAVRGKGSFQAAIDSLERLRASGLNRSVVLFVCLTKHNIHEAEAVITLAERHDVAMLVFSQWQKQGNAKDTPWAELAPPLEDWIRMGERLLTYSNPRLQVFGNFHGDLNNSPSGRFDPDGRLFPKQLYFYNAFPRVTPQGEIFADQLWVDPDWILGNTRETSLEAAFGTPKFHAQLESMRGRAERIEACRNCEWKRLCEGGSAGHTYAEYGHMDERDLFCESRMYWFERFVSRQVAKAFPR